MNAEIAFIDVQQRIAGDPVGAFAANVDAYNRMPLQSRYRRQLILSLHRLEVFKGGDLLLTDGAADRVYEISRSTGPDFPGVLVARLRYLVLSERNPDEVVEIVNTLREKASHKPEVQKLLEGIQ